MRIGVDATCWHNKRGYGRHARALLRALTSLDRENRYTLFLDSEESEEPIPDTCETRLLRPSVLTVEAASANGRRSLADMWRMSRAMSSPDFDMIFFPTIYSFVPTFGRARKLVMVHDVIAETFPKLTVPRPAARLFWKAKVALGRMQADALVTVSDYSRNCIIDRFGMAPSRVFVVGEAADPVFRKLDNPRPGPKLEKSGIGKFSRLVVYLGGFSPHKNLEALVDAFAQLGPESEDVGLVMVGETARDAFHTYFSTVEARVHAAGLKDRVIFTGFLPDEELVVLLNLASVLVLPSLMEGFGLPAIEAAACGCPVIATTASPLPGLLGEGGIFIEPRTGEIARALAEILASEERRQKMGARALRAAEKLTWNHAARQMMRVIGEVPA